MALRFRIAFVDGARLKLIMNEAFYRILIFVAETFEDLGIGYYVGGSVASITYGMPRSTLDVDIVAEIRREQVQPLVTRLTPLGYIDADDISAAITACSSFNIIPLEGPAKIDVFIPEPRPFNSAIFDRVRYVELDPRATRPFPLPSAEDIVLLKLEWYELTKRMSVHQWPDVLGVLQSQQAQLDRAYLRRWAGVLGLAELLEQAFIAAGV